MIRVALAGLALCSLATVAAAAPPEKLPNIRAGTSYSSARMTLAERGWRPVPIGSAAQGCSIGREDVCQQYEEAEACSGSGLGQCSFIWSKHHTRIQIITAGEDLDGLKVQGLRCREGCL
jgi:hypothetical protein